MNTWGGLVAAALLGGVAGAAGGHFSSGSSSEGDSGPKTKKDARAEEPNDAAEPAPGENRRPTNTSANVRIAALERRVSLLTAALARGDASLADEEGEQGDNVLDEVDVADPVFEAAVLDIMDRESERKEGERQSRRSEIHAERGRRFSADLTAKLALATEQQEKIAQVVTDHFTKFRELRNDESPDRPVTRRDFQQKIEEINKEALAHLEQIMTPAQFEKYQALDPDDQIGFGWGRGRSSPAPAGSSHPARE